MNQLPIKICRINYLLNFGPSPINNHAKNQETYKTRRSVSKKFTTKVSEYSSDDELNLTTEDI